MYLGSLSKKELISLESMLHWIKYFPIMNGYFFKHRVLKEAYHLAVARPSDMGQHFHFCFLFRNRVFAAGGRWPDHFIHLRPWAQLLWPYHPPFSFSGQSIIPCLSVRRMWGDIRMMPSRLHTATPAFLNLFLLVGFIPQLWFSWKGNLPC